MRSCRAYPESPKADLHTYLQAARDALLWKLDGYDVRRPMVPTARTRGRCQHLCYISETMVHASVARGWRAWVGG